MSKIGQTSDKKINPDRGVPVIANVNQRFADVAADDITCVSFPIPDRKMTGALWSDMGISLGETLMLRLLSSTLIRRPIGVSQSEVGVLPISSHFILHSIALPARGWCLALLHQRFAGVAPVMPCPCLR
ncbi:hypothetical protein HAX54_038732 [Datura stramonium]|uniref:Uncharacterized protein n=1 Tax=Datura stramonium TaxID=4076 RepID=A0ABS8SIG3_DATST|nr:hypothetical protein [Datura stramonium]